MSDSSPTRSIALRIAITIGAPLACWWVAKIPVPGIDPALLAGGSSPALGILALGITPALTAYVLAELACVLVPSFRPLRHGGPEARKKLDRAANVLLLLIATGEAYGMARFAELAGPTLWLCIGSWVAGACVSLLIARSIGRQGIANGFVLLWLVSIAITGSASPGPSEVPAGREIGIAIASVAVIALAMLVALRLMRPSEAERVWIPVPASSIAPFFGAVDGLMLLSAIAIANPHYAPTARMLAGSAMRPIILSGICALAAVVLSAQFHRPARARELLFRIEGEQAPSRRVIETAIFRAIPPTLFLFVCLAFAESALSRAGRSIVWIPLAIAVLFDLTDALRVQAREPDRVCVWEERRPYAVPALVRRLADEGISACPLQLGQQLLLQIFGPWVPVELWVERADAKRAKKLIESWLLDTQPIPDEDEEKSEPALPESPRRARVGLVLLSLCAALTIGLSIAPRGSARAKNVARLEIVAIDDALDPFSAIEASDLPHGVSIETESLPVAPAGAHHYALLVPDAGESQRTLLERVEPWLKKLALPSETRLAFGDMGDPGRQALRSYVLRGASIIENQDILRAVPVIDRERAQAYVGVELDGAASVRFREFTREHVQQRIAIVVEGKVRSAPLVRGEVASGKLTIAPGALSFDKQMDEATSLAEALGGS